jgi:hypothetical protein
MEQPEWKLKQQAEKKLSRRVMQPSQGFHFNPVRKLPRNMQCPCGSGKKFKRCHQPHMSPIISEQDLKAIKNTGGLK